MIAQYPGKCSYCGNPIHVGTAFQWGSERGQRIHEDCKAVDPPVTLPRLDTSGRKWSSYQENLFDFGINGTGNALVQAVAGSGKTTAIEEFCRRLPGNLRIKYLVFNKKNAVEAQGRMPSNVEASTFHSACNAAVSRRLDRPKLNDKKTRLLLEEMVELGDVSELEMKAGSGVISRVVGLGKNDGLGCLVPNAPEEWHRILDHHDIDLPGDADSGPILTASRLVEIAMALLDLSVARTDVIDFDDMLYMVVKLNIALPRYPMVCIDEAQDTNRIQRAILRKMVERDGRLIAVGDSRQAIYGFRGADSDAMDQLAREWNMVRLPLSINYRCSREVIKLAQQFCPELQVWEEAPEGSVQTAPLDIHGLNPTDAILCRTTAPLIETAFTLLRNGKGCTVLGRDIGASLIALINKMQGRRKQHITLEELTERLNKWEQREVETLKSRNQDAKVQAVQDKVESIIAVTRGLPATQRTLTGLIAAIESMFSDFEQKGLVTLATIHKSKGLEWEKVWILDADKLPARWAKQAWQQEQERNVVYIGYTRAKKDLVLVPAPQKPAREA